MRGSFQRTAEAINQTSEHLARDAARLASAEESRRMLSERVQKVVSGLSETASGMDHTAQKLAGMTEGSPAIVKNQSEYLGEQNLQQASGALNEASRRIGRVVDLISTIADQTKMLALNATIEGARAGEAGKGFAVVAFEVKKLSVQTADATADIGKEIHAVRATADLTSNLVKSLSETIGELKKISSVLNEQSKELTASMSEFVGNEE